MNQKLKPVEIADVLLLSRSDWSSFSDSSELG
jgi:hypothetical protein